MDKSSHGRTPARLRVVAGNVIITAALLVVIEGLSSYIVVAGHIVANDAIHSFQSSPANEIHGMFIQPGADDPTTETRLTAKGNELMARLVYNELKTHALVSAPAH